MAASDRPDSIVHWSEIEGADNSHYPGDDELMGIGSPFGRILACDGWASITSAFCPAGAPRTRTPSVRRRSSSTS